jgi:hypothetical protein
VRVLTRAAALPVAAGLAPVGPDSAEEDTGITARHVPCAVTPRSKRLLDMASMGGATANRCVRVCVRARCHAPIFAGGVRARASARVTVNNI